MRSFRSLYLFSFFVGFIQAQQLNLRTYGVKDGLPHTNVSQIIQDNKGYLWFSTHGGGISQFDGREFKNYSEKNGLCSNLTRPIIQDHTGKFWIGALGGNVCVYDGKMSKAFKPKGDSLPDKVYSIIEDTKRNIWFGSETGIFVYDGKVLKHLNGKNEIPEKPIMHVFQDSKKNIWIAPWESGVYVFDANNFKQIKDGLSYHTAMGFNEDHEGNILVSTFKGVTKISNFKAEPFHNAALDSGLVFKAVDDGRSKIYFATNGKGIIVYDYLTKKTSNITVKNGLPGNVVYNIFVDHEQNFWISCWGYGITKYSGNRFVHYTTKEGLLNNAVSCINQTNDGTILLGNGNGINSIRNNEVNVFNKAINNETVFSIINDGQGGIWFSGSKAIYHLSNGNLKAYTQKDGINAFPASSLAMDTKGNIWMGCWSGGVTKFDPSNTTFSNYTIHGEFSKYIYSMYCDKKGNVWACTWDEGLMKMHDGEFTYYKVKDGLPRNNIMACREDKDGNLWIATYGGGVAKFDGTKFTTISTLNGLSHDACNGILIDHHNNLWVATSMGLDKIDLNEFNQNKKLKMRHYGEAEGFPSLECLNNSLFEDKEGKIWFGTKNGVSVYSPSEDRFNTKEPIVHITNVRLFFEEKDLGNYSEGMDPKTNLPLHLKLPYTSNHLTFNFNGISYSVPEKVKYKFQLEGAENSWWPLTDKKEATYPGLQPGKYTFKVRACNNDGVWSKDEVRFEFEILPPWYKTWWAYASYVIIAIGGYFITIKWRTKKLTEEKEKLEKVVQLRTSQLVQQKTLLEVKNKEITDSIEYAKRIQTALMSNETYINKVLNRLQKKD